MKLLKKCCLLLFILIAGFLTSGSLPVKASGNSYYVSTSGNDSNIGSAENPFKTIQKGVNVATSGDTIVVLAGNYPERVSITKSGALGAMIRLQAQGNVITKGFSLQNANYIAIIGFEIANTNYVRWHEDISSGIYIKGGNNLIENNFIHDSSLGGISLYGAPPETTISHDNIIKNNRLYRNEMVGINVSGRNNLIEGNEIWDTVQCHPILTAVENLAADNAANPNCPFYPAVRGLDADGIRFFGQGHVFQMNFIHDIKFGPLGINPSTDDFNDNPHIDCFQTWSGTYNESASNILFEKNRCDVLVSKTTNENGHGFMLENANNLTIKNNLIRSFGGINTGGGGVDHLYIYNNLFANNLAFTSYYPNAIGLENTSFTVVYNNIIYDQAYHTINNVGTTTGNIIDYNLAFNSNGTTPPCIRSTGYNCVTNLSSNLWGVDPRFMDPLTWDYSLQTGSPAIDKGINLTSNGVIDDYLGSSRPMGANFDIGPFEYSASLLIDINGDGKTDILDLARIVNKRLAVSVSVPDNTPEDLDSDLDVDQDDLNSYLSQYSRL